ncbi:MAG: prepilin-type N-terminal cleavage/methylation domain-containing protein [Acidobacteriota bacterium]
MASLKSSAVRRCRPRSARRGISLLEILVALVLLTVLMTLVYQLLLAGLAEVSRSGRRLTDPQAEATLARLRVDLRGGSEVALPPFTAELWQSGPLQIDGVAAGGSVLWVRDGDVLQRGTYAPGEFAPSSFSPAMRGIRGFRWRTLAGSGGRMIEVELTWDETPPLGGSTAAGQRERLEKIQRTSTAVAFLRGDGGEDW